MIKAKSRDFLLIICGWLLLVIAFVTIGITLITTIEKISKEEKIDKVLNNVKVDSTKVHLIGKANFVSSTPLIDGRMVPDFKAKFLNKNDMIIYNIKFCNDNIEDVMISGLVTGQMTCMDNLGNIQGCENILDNSHLLDGSMVLNESYRFKAKSCITLVIDLEYVGDNRNEEIQVMVDQYLLGISMLEK